jgi:hypothetical protein
MRKTLISKYKEKGKLFFPEYLKMEKTFVVDFQDKDFLTKLPIEVRRYASLLSKSSILLPKDRYIVTIAAHDGSGFFNFLNGSDCKVNNLPFYLACDTDDVFKVWPGNFKVKASDTISKEDLDFKGVLPVTMKKNVLIKMNKDTIYSEIETPKHVKRQSVLFVPLIED